jgi:tRNA splicing endonuclease
MYKRFCKTCEKLKQFSKATRDYSTECSDCRVEQLTVGENKVYVEKRFIDVKTLGLIGRAKAQVRAIDEQLEKIRSNPNSDVNKYEFYKMLRNQAVNKLEKLNK